MKTNILNTIIIFILAAFININTNFISAQCTNSPYGQWPINILQPNCLTQTWIEINDAWTGEYSVVEVQEGSVYEFESYREYCSFWFFSCIVWEYEAYFTTITDMSNNPIIWGATNIFSPITWTATFTGQVRFYSHLSSACNSIQTFSNRDVRCLGSVLPVELVNFGIICDKDIDYNILEWTTESELNNDYFLIEGSYDGIDYKIIDTIPGQGTTNQQTNYKIKTKYNFIYYRLKQIDFDGTEKIYGPITNDCNIEDDIYNIYPNPIKDELNIFINSKKSLHDIIIIDNSGRIVYTEKFETTANINKKVLNLSQLSNGHYIIKINSKQFKFVKN